MIATTLSLYYWSLTCEHNLNNEIVDKPKPIYPKMIGEPVIKVVAPPAKLAAAITTSVAVFV